MVSVIYTVQAGDTIASIEAWFAQRNESSIFEANRAALEASLLRPGEQIGFSSTLYSIHP